MKMSRASVEQISKLPHKNKKSSEKGGLVVEWSDCRKNIMFITAKEDRMWGGFYHQPNIMKNNESNQA
jgi:hypothetical protein